MGTATSFQPAVRASHLRCHLSVQQTQSWRPAVVAAGITPTRATGMHALRHFYASSLLDAGESIKALASYLGHADPGFTLRVYTHLMPASEERTRNAIDDLFSTLAGSTAANRTYGDTA
ncbi:tyrosine-type recombinase/integrase [Micromonospora taraxaci]|nr:tyrosine-type recombinase/integrase [Micromonospora taraxaci]